MFRKVFCQSLALGSFLSLFTAPLLAHSFIAPSLTDMERMEKGEVVTGLRETEKGEYVTGAVLINEPPEKVWPIMVNPFEFRKKISPRMKEVEVMTDEANFSILKVTLDVFFMPHFTYLVESKYENGSRVEFKRIGGVMKDFKGTWEMNPACGGTKTSLIYSMYVDPGFPVPQWIIREGVKNELPHTLIALRKRINAVYEKAEALEPRTILAASLNKNSQTHLASNSRLIQ